MNGYVSVVTHKPNEGCKKKKQNERDLHRTSLSDEHKEPLENVIKNLPDLSEIAFINSPNEPRINERPVDNNKKNNGQMKKITSSLYVDPNTIIPRKSHGSLAKEVIARQNIDFGIASNNNYSSEEEFVINKPKQKNLTNVVWMRPSSSTPTPTPDKLSIQKPHKPLTQNRDIESSIQNPGQSFTPNQSLTPKPNHPSAPKPNQLSEQNLDQPSTQRNSDKPKPKRSQSINSLVVSTHLLLMLF